MRMEGIPNALMEAMACELPVIGTDISGLPELIQHGRNGLLVQPEDSPALANAIRQLVQDPALCRALGEAGRRWVAEHFNREINLKRLAELYRKAHRPALAGAPCRLEHSED